MYKALKVVCTAQSDSFVRHRFLNFGERVYVALRDDYDVSIDEIDKATDHFFVRKIHKRDARTAAKQVRQIAEKENMSEIVDITEIEDEK